MPWVTTASQFKAWKKWRQCSNADLARLTGLAASTIDKKLNGRTTISGRLPRELANIDAVIASGKLPADCPDKMRRLILAGRMR